MSFMKRLTYYAFTARALIQSVQNWWMIGAVVLLREPALRLRNGLKFRVRSLDDVLAIKEVCLDRVYERVDEIGKKWTIVDIGAGIGDFSVMNDARADRIVCYESDPRAASILRNNLSLNRCSHTTVVNEPAIVLLDILNRHRFARCDLMKIDCEGCEYPLLLSADARTLRRIRRVTMEYHLFSESMKQNFLLLQKRLRDGGFTVLTRPNVIRSDIGFLFASRKGVHS